MIGKAWTWLKTTWAVAYGVPAWWLYREQWRNRHISNPCPWRCFVCRHEWLPGDESYDLAARLGSFLQGTGYFVPGWAGKGRAYGLYHADLDLWVPILAKGQQAIQRIALHIQRVHTWHFRPAQEAVPAKGRLIDALTDLPYDLISRPRWKTEAMYAAKWTRAHLVGLARFLFLFFRALWAWAWAMQPIGGLHIWAYALDDLVGALGMARGPWPATMLLYATLWGKPANVDWYMDLCQEGV